MNQLTKTLLAGAALCALATVPAIAQNALPFHITALHGGRVVNKTKMPNHGATHVTYTFGVYTYVSFSDYYGKKVRFAPYGGCGWSKVKVSPKKTEYAKLGTYSETYSTGCAYGPTIYSGVTYKLTNPNSEGHTDHYVATWTFKSNNGGTKYKGKMNVDVSLFIE